MHQISPSFFAKHHITQVTQSLYSPDLVPCDFWLFLKLNHLWKGRDFRPSMRFWKIQQGSWWQSGELCEVPKCLLWRGLRHHCPMWSVSFIFFNRCLFFTSHGWIPSGQTFYFLHCTLHPHYLVYSSEVIHDLLIAYYSLLFLCLTV